MCQIFRGRINKYTYKYTYKKPTWFIQTCTQFDLLLGFCFTDVIICNRL